MNKPMLKAALAALAIMVAACAETAEEEALPADTVATSAAPAPAPAQPVEIDLDEIDDSNVSGKATATHSPTDVTISIVLDEGDTGTTYPAHVHTGTCEAGGPVAVELTSVSNLQSSTTVALSSLPANQDAFVQVHDASGKPVACGDMKGHGDDDMSTTTPMTTTTY